jgi:iron(III) transport system substrate-binding protein
LSKLRILALGAVMIAAGLALAPAAWADDLPPATLKMLKALKFDNGMLDGIDNELKVPQAWVDGAKKEGAVIVYDTMRLRDWDKIYSVFSARYPFVKIDHQEVHTSTRRYVMPLTSFKQGRTITDVIINISGNARLFREANAFENLSDLPNYKFLPEYGHAKDGITVTTRLRHWCLSYNTRLVKKEDLPKTWDDLVESPVLAGKKLMIGNRPNNWVLALWQTNGDAWAESFLTRLFDKVQPQIRKEGLNALVKLTSLGEGHAAVPQAMNRVSNTAATGAPVGFHCPEPVTFALTEAGIMRNSAHINGAKIFMNWLISREGQIAQYWADESTPVRIDMQSKEFLPYPEEVAGKTMATPGDDETKAKLQKRWNALWLQGGGTVDNTETE